MEQFQTVGAHGSCVQRNYFWPSVHETSAVVAQDQGVFSEGKSISHDQGHAAMPSCLGHVEETLVPHPGPSAGGFLSTRNAFDGCFPHGMAGGHEWPLGERSLAGPLTFWHINRLEMMAVFRALKYFRPDLRGHHVLVLPDNTLMVSYIRADILLRQGLRPGEWRFHPEVVELLWENFGQDSSLSFASFIQRIALCDSP